MTALKRELGVFDALLLIAGSIIGAGVFIAPNLVAQQLDSAGWILAAWAGGGVLSLLGALVFAELGAMFPATGGQYVYLREAFGPHVSFLFGWTCLLATYSAAIAWMAVSFSIWAGPLFGLGTTGQKAASVLLILAAGVLNGAGLKAGARTQDLLTILKLMSLGAVIVVAWRAPAIEAAAGEVVTPAAFGIALVGCLLSYDGWSNAGMMAGEMRHPQRDLPRALGGGVLLVMAAYLLANAAYLRVMTPRQMAGADRVAALAMERAAGGAGGNLVAAAIALSSAGVCFAWMLTAPRLYFAMARDGCFFQTFGRLNHRFETPANAIALQGAVAIVLVLSGAYQTLAAFAMFSAWFFYAVATAGLLHLRKTRPEANRPFRVPGYPFTPLMFLLAASAFLVNTLIESPKPVLAALALMAAGLPVYRIWSRKHG